MGHLYHGYVSHNQRVVIIVASETSMGSWILLLEMATAGARWVPCVGGENAPLK